MYSYPQCLPAGCIGKYGQGKDVGGPHPNHPCTLPVEGDLDIGQRRSICIVRDQPQDRAAGFGAQVVPIRHEDQLLDRSGTGHLCRDQKGV